MGQEIERIEAGAIPPALAQKGMQVVQEAGGYRAVSIPDAVREAYNVLAAVESVAQANPLYAPSVNTVLLGKDHVYVQERGSFELNKRGVIALARAAGISVKKTERMPRSVLRDKELGWTAVIEQRRADGTLEVMSASRIMDLEAEWAKTLAQAGGDAGRAKTRWSKEREHFDAKCETKAILRAIRAQLQIPGKITEQQLAKPFLVISWTLAPDYADPEVRSLALRAAFGAGGAEEAAYGGGHRELEAPKDAPAQEPEAREVGDDPRAPDPEDEPIEVPVEDVQVEDGPPPGVNPETGEVAPPEPEPPAPAADEGIGRLGEILIDFGRHQGKSLGEVWESEPGYVHWLARSASSEALKDAAIKVVAKLDPDGEKK